MSNHFRSTINTYE